MINRRQFLKSMVAAVPACAALQLEGQLNSFLDLFCEYEQFTVTIDDELIKQAITLGPITWDEPGKAIMDCSFDLTKAWRAVTLSDEDGNTWYSVDGNVWWPDDYSYREFIDLRC